MTKEGQLRRNERPISVRFSEPFEFDVTLRSEEVPALAVRWGGYQHLAPGDPPNVHVEYLYDYIILVLTGKGQFSCQDRSWTLEPGVVFWARQGLSTRVELCEGSPTLEHLVVMSFGRESATWFDRYLGSNVGAAHVIDPDAIARLYDVLMDEGCGASLHREANCVDLVKTLFRRLHGQLHASGRTTRANARETYTRARKYIQLRYSTTRDLREVASAVEVSVPHLCRLFERYGKTTPFDYLTKLKLTKAERLLCTGDLSIREIGQAVGYRELHLFSRNFKAAYGLSPSYYRKARRDEAPPSELE